MAKAKRFQKRSTSLITAVQLDLETSGFAYEKWARAQSCKAGDWVVDNDGDIYTIDAEVFAKTYRPADTPGRFVKSAQVFAERVEKAGSITTKEGITRYDRGDYIVFNDAAGKDGYAVAASKFEEMYEQVDGD